jgi:hypothetical protein
MPLSEAVMACAAAFCDWIAGASGSNRPADHILLRGSVSGGRGNWMEKVKGRGKKAERISVHTEFL